MSEDESKNVVGKIKQNSILLVVTLVLNLVFTVFWVATQAARISATETAIAENKILVNGLSNDVRGFISRVDRQETPLSIRVIDLERRVGVLDDRLRTLTEKVSAIDHVK